ncbi:MAG: VTT domain-containing protein [Bacteroidetes bacterium]|nr:VTT domain-containing protein [Bacteroidota bacterium]
MEQILTLFHTVMHIVDHFEMFVRENQGSIYMILFLIIFVETGLIVMPLLPGDSLLFVAGAACASGLLSVWVVIPLLIVAALLGDNVNYFVGKFFGDFVKSKERILFFKREYIDQTHEFYEKNGGKTVIMARFVPIVRTIAPFVAGAGSMTYSKYIVNCIAGAVLWVAGITLLGYAIGNIPVIHDHIKVVELVIIVLSVLPILIGFIRNRMAK